MPGRVARWIVVVALLAAGCVTSGSRADTAAPTRALYRKQFRPSHHYKEQPGQAEIAAAGGADRRFAKIAAASHGSIARSAPLGAAAPLPLRGAMRQRRLTCRSDGWRCVEPEGTRAAA